MPETNVGKELVKLEREYWNAIKEKNTARAVSLSDDPCVVVGSRGVGEIDNQTMAEMLDRDSFELTEFAFENVRVRPVAENVAVVAYTVKEKLVVDGEPIELEAFDSSVWVRRKGKWFCALHTETLPGDPYGRN